MDRGKKKIKQLPLQIPILNYVVGIYQNSCNSWNKRGFDDDADCCASVLKVLAQENYSLPISLTFVCSGLSVKCLCRKKKKKRITSMWWHSPPHTTVRTTAGPLLLYLHSSHQMWSTRFPCLPALMSMKYYKRILAPYLHPRYFKISSLVKSNECSCCVNSSHPCVCCRLLSLVD